MPLLTLLVTLRTSTHDCVTLTEVLYSLLICVTGEREVSISSMDRAFSEYDTN